MPDADPDESAEEWERRLRASGKVRQTTTDMTRFSPRVLLWVLAVVLAGVVALVGWHFTSASSPKRLSTIIHVPGSPPTAATVAPLMSTTAATATTSTRPVVVLTADATLVAAMSAAGQRLIGKNPTGTQDQQFAEYYHQKETLNQENRAAGRIYYSYDPKAEAAAWLGANDPVEVQSYALFLTLKAVNDAAASTTTTTRPRPFGHVVTITVQDQTWSQGDSCKGVSVTLENQANTAVTINAVTFGIDLRASGGEPLGLDQQKASSASGLAGTSPLAPGKTRDLSLEVCPDTSTNVSIGQYLETNGDETSVDWTWVS